MKDLYNNRAICYIDNFWLSIINCMVWLHHFIDNHYRFLSKPRRVLYKKSLEIFCQLQNIRIVSTLPVNVHKSISIITQNSLIILWSHHIFRSEKAREKIIYLYYSVYLKYVHRRESKDLFQKCVYLLRILTMNYYGVLLGRKIASYVKLNYIYRIKHYNWNNYKVSFASFQRL